MERGGFRIIAESDSRSLLLLPIQFSRCFEITTAPTFQADPSSVRLLRGNAIHTLLEFTGHLDATVRFRFGLAGHTQCRFQDAADFRRLEPGS
jgi:hypothetical protein